MSFSSHWCLDSSVTCLNHGSYGACPVAVLAAQSALRLEMEREPVDFLSMTLPARLGAARESLAAFLEADPSDLVFVANAISGVNAVLRSLDLEPGDELLLTSHTYAACRKAVEFVAARSGAHVVVELTIDENVGTPVAYCNGSHRPPSRAAMSRAISGVNGPSGLFVENIEGDALLEPAHRTAIDE